MKSHVWDNNVGYTKIKAMASERLSTLYSGKKKGFGYILKVLKKERSCAKKALSPF